MTCANNLNFLLIKIIQKKEKENPTTLLTFNIAFL